MAATRDRAFAGEGATNGGGRGGGAEPGGGVAGSSCVTVATDAIGRGGTAALPLPPRLPLKERSVVAGGC